MPVSYTHLRAHETDTSLFVGSVRMCIRDRDYVWDILKVLYPSEYGYELRRGANVIDTLLVDYNACLLYTSPSPRDGHLSIRRQRQNVYKRQGLRMGHLKGTLSQRVWL